MYRERDGSCACRDSSRQGPPGSTAAGRRPSPTAWGAPAPVVMMTLRSWVAQKLGTLI